MIINKPIFFQSIPIVLPLEKIYKRLGFRKHFTQLSDSQQVKIENAIEQAFDICSLGASYRRFTIESRDSDCVTVKSSCEDSIEFRSSDFSAFLKDSSGVFLFAATAGPDITARRDDFIKEEKAFEALIYDAVGSEAADEAVNWLNRYLLAQLIKEGRTLTARRYSPGYGNLGLEYQKTFLTHLQLEKIGVQLTENFLMLPEKSVTAAAGIIG